MRAPEAPTGWPRGIAPPLTLVISCSRPSRRIQPMVWAAKASLISMSPMSAMARPSRLSSFPVAGTGPYPMTPGSTPAAAEPTHRAMGLRPSARAFSPSINRSAAAPSLMPLELPAVTVPPSRKDGASRASFSIEVSRVKRPFSLRQRGCSSVSTMTGAPFARGASMGTISSAKRPASMAATVRRWLSRAKASCSSRPICISAAMFSAVSPRLTMG